jgi:hypothetical protein
MVGFGATGGLVPVRSNREKKMMRIIFINKIIKQFTMIKPTQLKQKHRLLA